jgi:integrase
VRRYCVGRTEGCCEPGASLPDIRFHDLRHTCATLPLTKGVHPKIVSEMLGHASVAITLDTYSHVIPGMQDAAASAMEDALGNSDIQ